MYDRQTQSLWPQIQAQAVAGTLTGTRLDILPTDTVPWQQWRRDNPNAWVLSRDTGYTRDYGRNPYIGYDEPQDQPFALDTASDPRLLAKERIVAFPAAQQATAIRASALAAAGVIEPHPEKLRQLLMLAYISDQLAPTSATNSPNFMNPMMPACGCSAHIDCFRIEDHRI